VAITSTQRLEQNIKAREEADDFISKMEKHCEKHPDMTHDRFWELVASMAAGRVGRELIPKDANAKMTDPEARAWEKTTEVTFGKYKLMMVSQVPIDYWGAIFQSEFTTALQRYLRSDHFIGKVCAAKAAKV
jgi:hypothetical protein